MNKLERDIIYLTELLNDRLEDVGRCEDICPYNDGCNNLIKQNGISLCGAIEKTIKNN